MAPAQPDSDPWRTVSPNADAAAAGPSTPSTDPSTLALSGASLPPQFGRYRIVRRLGQGGMGSVYLAHDTQLDRPVALKVPHFSPASNPDSLERFYREARLAATLSHPNICPVYDSGALDGIPYLTMAYIEGRSLSDVMQSTQRLPPRHVARLLRQVALALHEAHLKGVIHRDLKPANIMIGPRGEPIVMDFGLARRTEDDLHLTQTGTVVGTPAYMAPEQMSDPKHGTTPRSDIYSLGVLLYEILSGRVPFEGPLAAVLGQTLTMEPPPPSAHRSDVDAALEAICLKAMAKRPEQRFQSMKAMAAALADYVRTGNSTSVTPQPVAAPTKALPVPPARRHPPRVPAAAPRGFARLGWGLGALLLAFLLGGGLAFYYGGGLLPNRARPTAANAPLPPARWTLEINQSYAEVYVDDKLAIFVTPQANTPFHLELTAGKHELKVTKDGYKAYVQQITCTGGKAETLKIALLSTATGVVLEVDQAYAEVYVDGKLAVFVTPEANKPFRVDLTDGTHELRVTKEQFRPFVRQITVVAGVLDTLKVHLMRQ